MTEKSITTNIEQAPLIRAMITGAIISFSLMALFVSGVTAAKPEWGPLWMLRPLVVISFAGAVGGTCAYFLSLLTKVYGWNRALTVLLSVIIYVVGLWIGAILGLHGTMWN